MDDEFVLTPAQRQRIHVVGTSGSGKSTLARELSRLLEAPYVELDALHWLKDWQEEDNDRFREKLKAKLRQKKWVLDGNYFSKSVDIQWAEQGGATTVVWCDYSFPLTLTRATKRAFIRAWNQTEIWPGTGNRESFSKSFFSHDSVILWTIISYRHIKTRYGDIIENNNYEHIRFVRLRSPNDCKQFLQQFSGG